MALRYKIGTIVVVFLMAATVGYLILLSHKLAEKSEALSKSLKASESKCKLLDDKYKEEKASANRAQRAALAADGKLRQAKLDIDKLTVENAQLLSQKEGSTEKMKQRLVTCETERQNFVASMEKFKASLAELEAQQRKTVETLKERETEKKALTEKIQTLTADLQRNRQQSERYHSHNAKLCGIAQTLVARVEQEKLGSSVLVKEPLVQFKRVELEKLLQEYLDKIDNEKIVQ